MNQGAKRHALAERGHDLYETPECATMALLRCPEPVLYPWPTEGRKPCLWEPAAGRGAILRVLDRFGFPYIAHDLVAYDGARDLLTPGVDFLTFTRPPPVVEAILTNPPFMHADKFVRHGVIDLGLPMIVLLRLVAIEGAGRSDLMDKHCWRIWAGIERLPMMNRDGWAGKTNTSTVPYGWFVFLPEKRPDGQAIELRRISWRSA